jgi:hypothetical protein
MPLTDDEINALLDGCEGGTPGPWRLIGWHPNGLYGPGDLHSAKAICHFTDQRSDKEKVVANRDSEHIARCDPGTIAELCTRLLSAEAKVKVLEEALETIANGWSGMEDLAMSRFAREALQEQSK